MNHRERLQTLIRELQESPDYHLIDAELGPPATDAEIQQVNETLGFELDERFLDYFRGCNGATVSWIFWEGSPPSREKAIEVYQTDYQASNNRPDVGADTVGSFVLPKLSDLVSPQAWHFNADVCSPGEMTEPVLGGFDAHELRMSLRWVSPQTLLQPIDRATQRDGLLIHPRFPDPVVIFGNDDAADISSCMPMIARTYFDVLVATGGAASARAVFRMNQGYSGDHPVIEFPEELWGAPFPQPGYSEAILNFAKDRDLV